ncbi:RNA polymerase sigma factor, partial [Actinocorallia lasiicapitis]
AAPRRPLDAPPPSEPSPERHCLARDRLSRTASALRALPPRCRDLLRLLAASASYTEVSAALDVPMGSIGPTRSRCLRRLQEAVGD